MRLSLLVVLLALPAAALPAAAPPAAARADVVPLRHGTYVQQGTPCADPPFAAMMNWDGIGMADPHSHACRARLIARHGASYTIANSCIGVGVGPGTRSTERMTITPLPHDAARIDGGLFHYCPTASLPPSLRTRAVR